MNNTINLKEALKIIDLKDNNGLPVSFDIGFRTLNRNSKTGGALRFYASVTFPKKRSSFISEDQIKKGLVTAAKTRRNPNHYQNRTRNLQKQNGELFKVNIRLIDSINNQKVVY